MEVDFIMSQSFYSDPFHDRYDSRAYRGRPVDRAGRFWAFTVYILYIVAFFSAFPAVIGVAAAYYHRRRHGLAMRETFDWQIRIFWLGVLAWMAIGLAHAIVSGLAAVTFGVGAIFIVIPWAMIAAWVLWTVWAIARGLGALR